MKCIGQSLDLCRRLIAFLDCNDVDILLNGITFCRLGCKSIRCYVQACLQGIVSVDDTECNAGKLLRNLGSLNLNQLQVVRILCHIVNRCGNADTVIKLDQAFLLQKKQSSCLIGGVVRDCNCITICNIIKACLGSAVDAERLVVDLSVVCNGKMCAVLLVEGVQVIHMLEVVGIKLVRLYNVVRLNIILEYSNLEIIAFLCQKILNRCKNLRVRGLGSCYLDDIVTICRCCFGRCCLCGCCCLGCCSIRCLGISGRAAAACQNASCKGGCCKNCNNSVFHNSPLFCATCACGEVPHNVYGCSQPVSITTAARDPAGVNEKNQTCLLSRRTEITVPMNWKICTSAIRRMTVTNRMLA